MKLTTEQFNELRSSVESVVTGYVETLMTDTMDNYFRDRVMDNLSDENFTEDEVDEISEVWENFDDEGEIDSETFIKNMVDGIMEKYKK